MFNVIELPKTHTRQEWLEQRRDGIGSSDCSTILGMNEYESAYGLWLQKTGQAPLDPTFDERTEEIMLWGNLHEPTIRDETALRLGIDITKPDIGFAHPDRFWQRANLDGITSDGRIFEAKTCSLFQRDHWIDQIHDHAELQVHHAAAVTGATAAVVACLIGGNELVIHEIDINPTIVEMVTDTEGTFWQHVIDRTEPPITGDQATYDTLISNWKHREAREIDADTIEPELWAYKHAVDAEKAAQKDKRAALTRIAALMDGADVLTTGSNVWAKTQRGILAEKKLQAAHPDLFEQYVTTKPAFDRDRFKADHPDLFQQFQALSIRPNVKDL